MLKNISVWTTKYIWAYSQIRYHFEHLLTFTYMFKCMQHEMKVYTRKCTKGHQYLITDNAAIWWITMFPPDRSTAYPPLSGHFNMKSIENILI